MLKLLGPTEVDSKGPAARESGGPPSKEKESSTEVYKERLQDRIGEGPLVVRSRGYQMKRRRDSSR